MTTATHPAGPAPLLEEEVLDPRWLTAAVQARTPGAEITTVTVTERLETVATKIRFDVGYAEPVLGAPDAMCVKGYFNPARHASLGASQTESIFYRDFAAGLPVRTPPLVYADIDAGTGHGVVLMDDLKAAGATFLDPLVGYAADEAARTLEQLALVHGATWGPGHGEFTAGFPNRLAMLAGMMPPGVFQELLDDGRAPSVPGGILRAERIQQAVHRLADRAAAGPGCLVHGDVHTGNVYRLADGSPGVIDWQVAQWGSWALDVAYHLAAVLDPDERGRSERELVDHYLARLAATGAEPPGRENAWLAYREHLPYALFMWGITRNVARPIVEALTDRVGVAVDQHQSLELLGV